MCTRCRGAYIAAAILVAAHAATVITVDDSDPDIQHRGTWTHNPWGRQDVNHWSTVTFTNASGSTATYTFQGEWEGVEPCDRTLTDLHTTTTYTAGTAIAVFGAFEMSGTYNVHSSYSVDSGPATDFVPADTFVQYEYGQKFFQSDTLSDEEHTLVITNLGEEFWFDYLEVMQQQQQQPTTTSSQATTPQQAPTPSASTIQATSSATDQAMTGSIGQPETAQSLSGLSPQTQSVHSFSNTNDITLTSTDAVATPPPYPSNTSHPQTPTFPSGGATSTSTATCTDSSKLPAGAIAGLAIASFVVLVLVAWVGHRYGRRKRARSRNDLTPYGVSNNASDPIFNKDSLHE